MNTAERPSERVLPLVRFQERIDMSVFAAGWEGSSGGDGPLSVLSAASFVAIVGAKEGVSDDIARWHEDWGPCGDHEAFSVLLPMRPVPTAAQNAYKLQFKSMMDYDAVHTYDYQFGDAIIVDGRAPHRTCPFTAEDLAKATPSGERVLVCLNFASTDPKARPAQRQVMESQTPNYFQLPD